MKDYVVVEHMYSKELSVLTRDEYNCSIGFNYEPIDSSDDREDAVRIMNHIKEIGGVQNYLKEVMDSTSYKKLTRDDIVKKIKVIRNATHMSQREFSMYMGIPLQTLQHWEQGKSVLTESYVNIIERCLIAEGKLSGKVEI